MTLFCVGMTVTKKLEESSPRPKDDSWKRLSCGRNYSPEARKVKDVGVMKDEELKVEEIESSHTL